MLYCGTIYTNDSESFQKKGMVLLVHCSNVTSFRFDRKRAKVFWQVIRDSLPAKIRSIHACVPLKTSPFSYILPIVRHLMGRDVRRRLLLYTDSIENNAQAMEKYALKRGNMPTTMAGEIDADETFAKWLEERRKQEYETYLASQK